MTEPPLTLEYATAGTTCRSVLVTPPADVPTRGGVVVFPTWKGVEDFARGQATRLADLGYAALAVDVYGEGRVAATDAEAAELMQGLATDRARLRARARAGLDQLADATGLGPERLGGIGFCFGGMAVLELARSGAAFAAAVSFHGFFNTPDPADARQVKASILAHHGTLDPLVPMDEVEGFRREMDAANVDWQVVLHGGAMHGFMNPAASAPQSGIQYHPAAAARAWGMTQAFFEERLGGQRP